jgi:PAS domain S-box-containing protein
MKSTFKLTAYSVVVIALIINLVHFVIYYTQSIPLESASNQKTDILIVITSNTLALLAIVLLLFEKLKDIKTSHQRPRKIRDVQTELDQQRFALDQHSIVAITDIKGNITYVNDKFTEISEFSRNELIGSNHRILNSNFHDKDFFRNLYLTISKGKVWNGEICNHSKSGRIYWVDTTIVPFKDTKNKITSYVSIRTDITQKILDQDNLVKAKEQAELAVQAKSDFLANMSHEIRTPINGVIGMLTLIENTELNDNQFRKLKIANHSAQSLLTIINDILDFSKIEAGKLNIEHTNFNLIKLLDNIIQEQAIKSEEKGLALILDTNRITLPEVIGDPIRIKQILNNLISNALKFTNKGEIVVKASLQEKNKSELELTCSIQDTGIGISKLKKSDLFEAFTQANTSTTREYGGTGLGLSISKKLCKLMGGNIHVSSTEGKGSCFTFIIKLKKSESARLTMQKIDLNRLTILIVDDNTTNLEVLKEQLENWNATILIANSGKEALNTLIANESSNESNIDIAILDMQMPFMDGVQLGQIIRENKQYNDIKLIMMTSMCQHKSSQYFSDLGFQAYFPKPVSTEDLYKTLTLLAQPNKNLKLPSIITTNTLQGIEPPKQEKNITDETINILLVEDNLINQEVALGLLEGMYTNIIVANNGIEALEILNSNKTKFDVILMDCQMPLLDGYQTTQAIRNNEAGEHYNNIRIIAMTANAMKGDKEKCIEAGMNEFISKPIDIEILAKKLSI